VITQGSGPVQQHGKHSLFVKRLVLGVGMEIEDGVYVGLQKTLWPSEP
jgi:hypothetical protein